MKKILYYTLSCTWGVIMTLIGAIVTLFLFCIGYKVHRHGGCFYTEIGESWGGLELGLFFLCNKGASKHIKDHEFGHSLQNCIWGPLFPFVIAIPSAIRYWLIEWKIIHVKNYDDIWFEGQATKWGEQIANQW